MPLFGGQANLDYQDVLRAIGRLMDAEGLHNFRIVEQEHSLILQVNRQGEGLHNFETYLLTESDVQALLHDAYRLRGVKPNS